MYQWGNPYTDDNSWEQLNPGDKCRVIAGAYQGRIGILKEITFDGTYLVEFELIGREPQTCGYDGDMLTRLERG